MVRVTGAGGFGDNVGITAQALADQALLYRADSHRCRDRQGVRGNLPVTQHHQYGTGADSGFRIVAQGADRLFQCGFPRIKAE